MIWKCRTWNRSFTLIKAIWGKSENYLDIYRYSVCGSRGCIFYIIDFEGLNFLILWFHPDMHLIYFEGHHSKSCCYNHLFYRWQKSCKQRIEHLLYLCFQLWICRGWVFYILYQYPSGLEWNILLLPHYQKFLLWYPQIRSIAPSAGWNYRILSDKAAAGAGGRRLFNPAWF